MSEIGYNGRLLKVKLGDPAVTIAAVQSREISRSKEPVDVTNDDSAGNRTLLPTAGVRTIDISVEGVATSANYNDLIERWNGDTMQDVTLVHPDGTEETADFFMQSLSHNGEHSGSVQFSAELLSSGAVTTTPPPSA